MRLSMWVDPELRQELNTLTAQNHLSLAELIERGVIAIALVRAAREKGLMHVGFTSDPNKLDAELRGLFPEMPHLTFQT